MAHIRTQLRDALKTRLTGLATTGARVFANRFEKISDAELPALEIMNDSEQIVSRSIGSQAAPHARSEMRTVSFVVRAMVKTNTAPDDALDQICLEVEKAVASDIFFGGKSMDARLGRTLHRFDADGEKIIGIAEMIFELDAWVSNTDPDVII